MSVDLFFGGNDGLPQSRRQIEMAKAVCRRCPVARDCLIFALGSHEPHGVWGGMARHERERAMIVRSGDVAAVVRDYEAQVLLGSLEDSSG
jgi:WhiB family transcriptional regulator, redox-sensing transcriptional regulator